MLIPLTEKEKLHVQKIFKNLALKEGSQYKLARAMRLTEASISQLVNGKYLPSARLCMIIEAKYGIKKEELRPDIFLLS